MASLERKRMLYKSQKTAQDQSKYLSQKTLERKASNGRNQSNSNNLVKGKSAAMINEYLKN